MKINRLFLKWEVNYPNNRKVRALLTRYPYPVGPAAGYLHLMMAIYCKEQLTDGFVPEESGPLIAAQSGLLPDSLSEPFKTLLSEPLKALVEVGLLEEVNGGWNVHGFTERNGTRADIEKASQEAAKWGRQGGIASGRSRRTNGTQNRRSERM